MVEYVGMKNLIDVVKDSIGLRRGKLLFGFEGILSCECKLTSKSSMMCTCKNIFEQKLKCAGVQQHVVIIHYIMNSDPLM